MKAPQAPPEPGPEAEPAPDAEAKPAPPPEPWTPERALAWNAYYDLYVAAGVLLMAFLTSAVKVANSAIWAHLQAGRLILRRGPLTADPFSYTVAGQRWVDIPWLFQAAVALLYQVGVTIVPGDTPADLARADKYGAIALVAANALVRLLTVLILMGLRRPGPGLWWVAVCATLPMIWPNGPAPLAPETWGMLLLAAELLLIHRATALGGRASAWALVPLLLLWANLDASFLVGLAVLAGAVVGIWVGRGPRGAGPAAWSPAGATMILAACAAACLVNPSTFRAYPTAAGTLAAASTFRAYPTAAGTLATSWHSPAAETVRLVAQGKDPGLAGLQAIITVALVVPGLASFLLNRRRFSAPRFFAFASAAGLLFASFSTFKDAFAIVLAATLATNGQEWFLGRFGASGRTGRGWSAWSIGGRAATIVGIFAAVALAITGYWAQPDEPRFGFGYSAEDFGFEAAEFLGKAPIRGRVLNTTAPLGDALIWRARGLTAPRETFVDSREAVFPPEVSGELQQAREGLRDERPEVWRPILDHHKIDVVMLAVNPAVPRTLGDTSPKTRAALLASKDWIPFYDDGNVALFGRADAPAEDRAFFEGHRLDPQAMAYRQEQPVALAPELPPNPSWVDRYFRDRALAPPQPHALLALRWLNPPVAKPDDPPPAPDLARCLLAVREARTAIARRSDDAFCYQVLADAYRALMAREAAILGGGGGLVIRRQQLTTALNFAIQAAPPPEDDRSRESLRNLNVELGEIYQQLGFLDLEREHLARARDLAPDDFTPEGTQRIAKLDEAIAEARAKMDDAAAEAGSSPLQRVAIAQQRGMIGLAIAELEDVEKQGIDPRQVKARLIDLYCQVGQADRAQELLGTTQQLNDPALETEPGMALYRQARVQLLLGNYAVAQQLYPQAIYNLRSVTTRQALETATAGTLIGDLKLATRVSLGIPSLLATEATWEVELGLILLEAGRPKEAAEAFTRALTLGPVVAARPLVAYYLEQMGKPVPPPPADPREAKPAPGELPADVFAS